ncbi:MAG: hypothetical protein HY261_11130, partial [Chloroflexi bacterium]|nr:hypothetical protein [Chloroflexota bacterium]
MRFLNAKRLSLAFAFAAILALIVGACGGGSDKTATPKPAATSPATAAQATATPRPAATPTFQGAVTATATPVTEQPRLGGVLRMRELVAFEPMDTFNL